MPGSKIGVRLECLGLPVRGAIESAARLGAGGVQFDAIGELSPDRLSQTGRRHLKHLITSHGLQVAAVGFPTQLSFEDIERLEERVAQTCEVLSFAYQMGSPIVVGQIGQIPEDRQEPSSEHFYEAMQRIGLRGEQVGSRFAIRTGTDGPQRLAKFLGESNRFGLAVNYEPAILMVRGHSVFEGVRILAEHILGVGIKDAIRSGTSISGYVEVPFGQGEMDWEQFLAVLAEIDYRGYQIIDQETGDHRFADITTAIEYLLKFRT